MFAVCAPLWACKEKEEEEEGKEAEMSLSEEPQESSQQKSLAQKEDGGS